MVNGIKSDGSPKVAVNEDSSLNENVFRGAGIHSDTEIAAEKKKKLVGDR